MYYTEFISLAIAHLLAVSSPGPDFAVIVRQSVIYDKPTARWSALGLGIGIMLHSAYSLLGIGLLFSQYDWLYTTVKIAGVLYLGYLGVLSIRSTQVQQDQFDGQHIDQSPSTWSAIRTGFLTNALNPKATLFILFLFTTLISTETPMAIRASYGVYMALATFVWFSFIAQVFSTPRIKQFFLKFGHWFDRILGGILILLALKVLFF